MDQIDQMRHYQHKAGLAAPAQLAASLPARQRSFWLVTCLRLASRSRLA